MAEYYVYKISPTIAKLVKPMDLLEVFENYKEARSFAREQRQNAGNDTQEIYKVIFAENALDAEEKLSEFREKPIVKEWEK
ncbi:MAG: hypothetical protein KAI02_04090 [Gammaproteobacteria bacterium]|nr:hypothetical protein [Gammaproteobacteria bacterium]